MGRRATHGYRSHPWYGRWLEIRSRCYNPKSKLYAEYGGLGVTVCEAWRDTPDNFIAWAEQAGLSGRMIIELVDKQKGYSPENCTLITCRQHRLERDGWGKSGVKGVYPRGGKWTAQLTVNKKTVRLGNFSSKEAAAEAIAKFKDSGR